LKFHSLESRRGMWLEEIVMMVDSYMPKPGKRGPCKKYDMEGGVIDGRIK